MWNRAFALDFEFSLKNLYIISFKLVYYIISRRKTAKTEIFEARNDINIEFKISRNKSAKIDIFYLKNSVISSRTQQIFKNRYIWSIESTWSLMLIPRIYLFSEFWYLIDLWFLSVDTLIFAPRSISTILQQKIYKNLIIDLLKSLKNFNILRSWNRYVVYLVLFLT